MRFSKTYLDARIQTYFKTGDGFKVLGPTGDGASIPWSWSRNSVKIGKCGLKRCRLEKDPLQLSGL